MSEKTVPSTSNLPVIQQLESEVTEIEGDNQLELLLPTVQPEVTQLQAATEITQQLASHKMEVPMKQGTQNVQPEGKKEGEKPLDEMMQKPQLNSPSTSEGSRNVQCQSYAATSPSQKVPGPSPKKPPDRLAGAYRLIWSSVHSFAAWLGFKWWIISAGS
ncbi:hypothetical protein U1Q18_031978 [Sarracenia purpurea var. burkii]